MRRGREERARPVMYDVARLAGVSHQTVSRVINDHPNVRPETRDRVRRAMDELGYRPNTMARGLAARRSRTIGVLSFDERLFGPSSTLQSIEQTARAHGYAVLSSSLNGLDATEIGLAVEDMLQRSVDGFIVIAPRDEEQEALRVLPRDVPMVALEAQLREDCPLVAIDNEAGGALVAEHLLGLGHRRVAHVAGPDDWSESRLRTAGWRAVLEREGIEEVATFSGDWSAASGYAAGRQLAPREDVTAVFVANDQMALGLLTALHEAGRRVPEDISVAGYDNHPDSGWYLPALTTVDQDFRRVGLSGLLQMVAAIDGEPVAPSVLVTPRLVTRSSTMRARGQR